jgi:hypothetical protein
LCGLVDEDELLEVEIELPLEPGLARRSHIFGWRAPSFL